MNKILFGGHWTQGQGSILSSLRKLHDSVKYYLIWLPRICGRKKEKKGICFLDVSDLRFLLYRTTFLVCVLIDSYLSKVMKEKNINTKLIKVFSNSRCFN